MTNQAEIVLATPPQRVCRIPSREESFFQGAKFGYFTHLLGALIILATSVNFSKAAIVPAGVDLDRGEFLRTTTSVKPLDGDGDNVYGTAGYDFFATEPAGSTGAGNGPMPYEPASTLTALPSFVSAITPVSGAQFNWGSTYAAIDNPTLAPGASVANVFSGLLISRNINESPILSITLTGTIPANIRIGVVVDNSDNIHDLPRELRLMSSNGDVSARVGLAPPNLIPDVYFFNVSGAHAGDVLTLYVTQAPGYTSPNYPAIGGLVFDTAPAAPTSLNAILATGTQTLYDDFTGTDLNASLWSRGMRFPHINGGSELQGYNPGNVTVANGLCTILAKKEPNGVANIDYTGTPTGGTYGYSSGCLETYDKFAQAYGYYEAKIRCATSKGTWPAFWLLPDRGASSPTLDQRTAVGNSIDDVSITMGNEIDILEYMATWKDPTTGLSKGHGGTIWGYTPNTDQSFGDYTLNDPNQLASPDTEFHTYGLLWEPGELTWYIDGNVVMTDHNPNIAIAPCYLILNLALTNDDWSGAGPSDSEIDATLPGTMDIDYVKVYSLPSDPEGGGSGDAGASTTFNVLNGGFETGSLTDGWMVTPPNNGYGSGVELVNNVSDQSTTYPNFSNPLPGTGEGTYYAELTGYDGNPDEVLYQDVSANGQGNPTLQPNTTYTLTVAVGVGQYSVLNDGYISLINGTGPTGTQLGTVSMSTLGFSDYANNFKDLTLTVTTGATVSGDLTVAIGTSHGYPSADSVAIDHVRLTSQPAGASTVAIVNHGFETGSVTDGWTITPPSNGYGSGVVAVNNVSDQSSTYPNFSNPLPGTVGTYYAAITGYDGNPDEVLYQDVTANGQGNQVLQPNTTYTLTVAVGVGRYSSLNDGYISLVNGTGPTGTQLGTISMGTLGFSDYANNFKDLTLTVTTGATVSGDLTVVIGTSHGYPSASFVAVNNVRLTKQ